MYFSRKMIRLILILGPASSVVGGIALEMICKWCYTQLTLAEDESDPGNSFVDVGVVWVWVWVWV